MKDLVTARINEKWQMSNPLVYWHPDLSQQLGKMIDLVRIGGLKKVLVQMTKGLKGHSTGFPDLFVFKKREYQFVEIKSPNDHLSEQQLFWIRFMNEEKINAKVVRLIYEN